MIKQSEYQTALASMKEELLQVKGEAEEMKGELDELSPEELTFDLSEDLEDLEELEPADKEKAKEIKTNEDAVKVLNEAKSDFERVIDFLDGQSGLTQETEVTASIPSKRMNEKFASDIQSLAKNSDKAISDAKDAINHWSFLFRIKKEAATIKNTTFAKAIEDVKEASKFVKVFNKLIGKNVKEGTAVPPTGATFTGDKNLSKNPRDVEDRNWHGGASRFQKDVNKEKSLTNPTKEDRLKYRQDNVSPDALLYVNSKLVKTEERDDSYWEVIDAKSGLKLQTPTFANLPSTIGPKDDRGWNIFSKASYGEALANNVIEYGIEATKRVIGGKLIPVNVEVLRKVAGEEGKENIKKYYTDAYGDSGYARDLTSGGGKAGGSKPGYKPEFEHVEDNKGETKDGAGKLSKKTPITEEDKRVITARAQKTIELARKFASRGAIPFTKAALLAKAEELMELPDETFDITETTIDGLPIVNEAALKSSHIPDTEKGIVGNEQQGVQDQKAQVKTENIDSDVASDAKIAKQSSLVPQLNTNGIALPDFSNAFTTTRSKLHKLGFDTTKLRKPNYRKG